MATTQKPLWASEVNLALTLEDLANAAARECTVVDNSSNLYTDALIQGFFKTVAGSLGTNPCIEIWTYGLSQGGSSYPDAVTGSNAGITMKTSPAIKLFDIVPIHTANVACYMNPKWLSIVYGSDVPKKWGIVIVNKTGLAGAASGAGTFSYIGYNPQSV
ncbi:MAG: hypothetical protein CMLOHMNK_02036 [Steroidobacteraceae bacterium]|nr:hypothetical protein [Steroidobacteraceae bacterium]